MKRNIKKENEIINKVMDEVKRMYVLEVLNNTGRGYTNFKQYTLEPIELKCHIFFPDEEGLMGEFNKYVCQFGGSVEGEKKIKAVIDKFVKAYYKKVRGYIEEIDNEIKDLNIQTLKGVMTYGKLKLEELNN